MNIILYLIGTPGTGKYTIAKELAQHGYIICDNQLINNPIFSLLNLETHRHISEATWDTIARIRHSVLDFLAQEQANNYVLTNCLYDTDEDREIYHQVEEMAAIRKSFFVPVLLRINQEENARRIQNKERLQHFKTTDPKHAFLQQKLLPVKHTHLLELDVSSLSAKHAAKHILSWIDASLRRFSF